MNIDGYPCPPNVGSLRADFSNINPAEYDSVDVLSAIQIPNGTAPQTVGDIRNVMM